MAFRKRMTVPGAAAVLLSLLMAGGCMTSKYQTAGAIATIEASFADPRWNGVTIPPGESCSRCGEQGSTPALRVRKIPPRANAIIMEYCDRSYTLMSNGGHGVIGFHISPNAGEVVIPSIPGCTFALPKGFFVVQPHLKQSFGEGAYLPPCSCRGGNLYSVKILAVYDAADTDESSLLLGECELMLGVDR